MRMGAFERLYKPKKNITKKIKRWGYFLKMSLDKPYFFISENSRGPRPSKGIKGSKKTEEA